MTDKKNALALENHEASHRLARLTPESPEAEIKSAFIAWNREILMPMFDDIIRVLEIAYRPYAKLKIIPDQEIANAKNYISDAIKILRVHRVFYCEMADSVAEATTLSQFLALMIITDLPISNGELSPVFYGMKDARISSGCRDELLFSITFRHDEAIRVAKGHIDSSWEDVLREQWGEHTKRAGVKSLDNIGTDKKANAKILYGYFNTVLHPLICAIFAMDKNGKANWWEVFGEVRPHTDPKSPQMPDFESLVDDLAQFRSRVETYLKSLPKSATRNPNYSAAREEFFKYIDVLQPYLLRLKTAKRVKNVG